jgi:hypothetical protein
LGEDFLGEPGRFTSGPELPLGAGKHPERSDRWNSAPSLLADTGDAVHRAVEKRDSIRLLCRKAGGREDLTLSSFGFRVHPKPLRALCPKRGGGIPLVGKLVGFGLATDPAAPHREGGERDLIPTKHSEGIGGYHEGAREPIF